MYITKKKNPIHEFQNVFAPISKRYPIFSFYFFMNIFPPVLFERLKRQTHKQGASIFWFSL